MGITDFISWVKRESRYGGAPLISNSNTDQPTIDILTSLNARRKRLWRKPGNWPWFVEQLSFPVIPGQVVYSVAALSGNKIDRIQNLIPVDPNATPPVSGLPLTLRTERQFAVDSRDYSSPSGAGANGIFVSIPRIYKNLGLVNGLWNIQIWPSPSQAFTMAGSAKGILNTFLIGDVTGLGPFSAGNTGQIANPPFDYFPDGVIEDILFEGVMSDVARIQGQAAEAKSGDDSFEGKIKLLAAEEANAAKDDTPITRQMPALVMRRMRRRSRSTRW